MVKTLVTAADWTPLLEYVLGPTDWEETLGQIQVTQEGLHLPFDPGAFRKPQGGASSGIL